MQEIIIGFLFLSAISYLVYIFKKDLSSKSNCGSSCGACSTIDLKKAVQEIERNLKAESL